MLRPLSAQECSWIRQNSGVSVYNHGGGTQQYSPWGLMIMQRGPSVQDQSLKGPWLNDGMKERTAEALPGTLRHLALSPPCEVLSVRHCSISCAVNMSAHTSATANSSMSAAWGNEGVLLPCTTTALTQASNLSGYFHLTIVSKFTVHSAPVSVC